MTGCESSEIVGEREREILIHQWNYQSSKSFKLIKFVCIDLYIVSSFFSLSFSLFHFILHLSSLLCLIVSVLSYKTFMSRIGLNQTRSGTDKISY